MRSVGTVVVVVVLAACSGSRPPAPATPRAPMLPPPPVAAIAPAPEQATPSECVDARTCHALGKQLADLGDAERAVAAFDRGCRRHHPMSCADAGFLVQRTAFGPAEAERAHEYYALACDERDGDPLACARAAVSLLQGIVSTGDRAKDRTIGRSLLQVDCEKDHGFSCYHLGVVYRDGMGTAVDDAQAEALFERACANQYARGCREQGLALRDEDPPRAVALFALACADEPQTCYDLANAYENGEGVQPDPARARELYDRACAADEPTACYSLGLMMRVGKGGSKDDGRARRLFHEACAADYETACDMQ